MQGFSRSKPREGPNKDHLPYMIRPCCHRRSDDLTDGGHLLVVPGTPRIHQMKDIAVAVVTESKYPELSEYPPELCIPDDF
jgi:hypothetical protein